MLQCVNLVKDYFAGGQIVHAVRDLSVTFRQNEFVSILGPSGCGKTTLLNIIGGLDQYNSGNLIINGKSTKDYTDKDWDTYRNHRVGFVFQSYNLIMHQSVLTNVEMSLVLSGVSDAERKQRAIAALKEVGLEDQIDKKPTQLSGGQMQRVAIARALVNNPEIVLADEPTGALDSKTSVQIMSLLKEVAKDRLVIMVTHNPELAREYSTRLIELRDGQIVSDSNPFNPSEQENDQKVLTKPSMSFATALKLSFSNLMTKKGRTLLTSFAGSIGIIGIGLIMSLSNGVQNYISSVENDTMASYPITLEDNTLSIATMFEAMSDVVREDQELDEADQSIHTRPMINSILESIGNSETNNLKAFKDYLSSDEGKAFVEKAKAIEYDYNLELNIYNPDSVSGLVQVSPNELLDKLGFSSFANTASIFQPSAVSSNNEIWHILPDSQTLRDDNYSLLTGRMPESFNEVVLEVNAQNQISDYVLYSLGLLDQDSLVENYRKVLAGETEDLIPSEEIDYSFEEIMDLDFRIVPSSSLYEKTGSVWISQANNETFVEDLVKNAQPLKVVGIIKPSEDKTVSSSNTMGGVYYDSSLQQWASEQAEASQIVKDQKNDPKINIFTGQPFSESGSFSLENLSNEQRMMMASMSQEEILAYMDTYNESINATYDSNLQRLGVIDYDNPTSISLYASSFEDKEQLADLIADYNDQMEAQDKPENVLSYTDYIGILLSGVQQVINMISYVLIGFVSVSLIVSSIMIGIITYISVLERIKEIGILRAIGASKRDIRNVFNAETFLIGLASGVLGIVITVILNIPISYIVQDLTGVANIAVLPWQGGLALILINLVLTMIAGLIPASIASKKNPVEALRVE